MPPWTPLFRSRTNRPPHWSRSLRVKTLAILLGGALVAMATGLSLILGLRQADSLIERGSAAQHQLELLKTLQGRIDEYNIWANSVLVNHEGGRERVAQAPAEVNAVFAALDRSIADQVALTPTEEGKNAEAVEGLSVARMKAMFRNYHANVLALMERGPTDRNSGAGAAAVDSAAELRRHFEILIYSLGPLIEQAIEVERSQALSSQRAMAALRDALTAVATALIAAAAALPALLYFGPLRSILRRISETVHASESLAAGRLGVRLELRGRDELTGLMASFNRMAEALSVREQELVEGQRRLQEMVDARTTELVAANTRLELIDENRKRFFADVSHELRTPLTVILGEAEVTLRHAARANLPEDARKSIETIQERARRLHRRVEDLLRVARSESGQIELNLTRMEAGAALAEACDDVAGLARKYSIALKLDKGHKLEKGKADLHVRGDKEWLRQVFGGIIANALKFSESGTSIEARAWRSEQGVEVEISDEGCGVAPEEAPKVFERFYRAANRDQSAETGHGVGLALAKWVIEEHKGRIWMESPGRMGRGTTLRIVLPSCLPSWEASGENA
jgi:two-component system, OmpR family, sensor kinase